MTKKDTSKSARPTAPNPERRKVVKLLAAGGLGAITSPWVFQTGNAAGRPIKIGMVSPSTGPIAAFGEADQWVLAEAKKTLEKGITVAGETHPVEILIATASQPRTVRRKWRRSSSTATRST